MSRWTDYHDSCRNQVLRFLNENSPRWFSIDEIVEGVGRKKGTVACALNWLQYSEIEKEKRKRPKMNAAVYFRAKQPTVFQEFLNRFESACAWGHE